MITGDHFKVYRLPLLVHVIAAIVGSIAANLWATRENWHLDLTASGVYSIRENTKELLHALKDPVNVTFFYDVRSQQMRDAKSILERFSKHSDELRILTVDPILEPSIARKHD